MPPIRTSSSLPAAPSTVRAADLSAGAPTPPAAATWLRSHGYLAAVALLVLAAGVLRSWGLGAHPLWLDEAYSAWFSSRPWAELWLTVPTYEPHPPLFYSLLKLWRELAGSDPAGLRGLSLAASLGTIVCVGLAAQRLGELSSGVRPPVLVLLAAGLAAASPMLLFMAQDARPYAAMTLAYAAAVLAVLRLASSFREGGGQPGRRRDWLLLGGATACVLWLHGIGLLFGLAVLAALLVLATPDASWLRWRRLAVTVGTVALVYLPCLFMLAARRGEWSAGWIATNPPAMLGGFLDLYGLPFLGDPTAPMGARLLHPLLLALALTGLWQGRDRTLTLALTTLLLLPPLMAAAASLGGVNVFLPRTLQAVLVPTFLLLALALVRLPAKARAPAQMTLLALWSLNLHDMMTRQPRENWNAIARTIVEEAQPGDRLWAYPNDTALPLEQALGRRVETPPARFPALAAEGRVIAGSPAVRAISGAQAKAWAEAWAVQDDATIFLVMGPDMFDPDGQVLRGLAGTREVRRLGETGNFTLYALKASAPVPRPYAASDRTR